MRPLEDIKVLDFSQFLAGPSVGLRLADLGATVIKVEQPTGDICRKMYTSNLVIDEDSSLFHVTNRNKEGICVDLKTEDGRKKIIPLIKQVDVLVVNFRPHVAERLGIDYASVKAINPKIIYGEITGFGYEGVWANKPGQDLVVQALSGMCMANGNRDKAPTPAGLSVADMVAGQHLVQGVLAGLIKRERTGEGAFIQVNLMESIMDLQFEGFTTFLNDGHEVPQRSAVSNANFYTNAPYGIYETKDWYITVAITPIPQLGELIGCEALTAYTDPATWSTKRDEIKTILAEHLKTNTTQYWLDILQKHDIWCADVYTWDKLIESDIFKHLHMVQELKLQNGEKMKVLRCPITIDKQKFYSDKPSPKIGQDNAKYFNN